MGRTSNARQRLMGAAHDLVWGFSYGAVTIEAICERARVKKGSFYYFFDSKSDLALAAIEAWWLERKAIVADIFQAGVPPLQRIQRYIDFIVEIQLAAYERDGKVLGCPLFSLGSEICKQNEPLSLLVQEKMACIRGRFEEAIAEAQASGEIPGQDASRKARLLWSFYEGALTQARIENNPEVIRHLSSHALEFMGAQRTSAVFA